MLKTDTLQITPELLALITEIDEFKGAWRLLGTIAPERLMALRCGLRLDHADGPLGRGKNNRIFPRHQCVNFARFRV